MRILNLAAVVAASLGLTYWAVRAVTRRRAKNRTKTAGRPHDDLRLTNL